MNFYFFRASSFIIIQLVEDQKSTWMNFCISGGTSYLLCCATVKYCLSFDRMFNCSRSLSRSQKRASMTPGSDGGDWAPVGSTKTWTSELRMELLCDRIRHGTSTGHSRWSARCPYSTFWKSINFRKNITFSRPCDVSWRSRNSVSSSNKWVLTESCKCPTNFYLIIFKEDLQLSETFIFQIIFPRDDYCKN